jgi:hypothetical protein
VPIAGAKRFGIAIRIQCGITENAGVTGLSSVLAKALGQDAPGKTGPLLAAELGALSARPDVLCCAALCEDAAQIERAAELGLDFVISPSLPPAPRLPVYQALAGSAGKALRPAIEAGAHGLAQAAARQP